MKVKKPHSFAIALALGLSVGCSTTRHLNPLLTSDFSEINELGEVETARIAFHDQRVFYANQLEVASDTTFWLDAETGDSVFVSTLQIQEIRFTNRVVGAAQGFFLVSLPIAAVNLQAGVIDADFNLGLGNNMFTTTLAFGLAGAGAGALVGHRRQFRFPFIIFTQ